MLVERGKLLPTMYPFLATDSKTLQKHLVNTSRTLATHSQTLQKRLTNAKSDC